jgi:phosphoribosylformylglycinamidine cyclo-ligase
MGHRMEVYCLPEQAQTVIDIARGFDIDAQIIGRTESSTDGNRLSLSHGDEVFEYIP